MNKIDTATQRTDEHGNVLSIEEAVARYGPTAAYGSESAKYLCLTLPFLSGNGLDIGSGGWPVVERAIQFELPSDKFNDYTGGRAPRVPIEWHGDFTDLPFKDGTLDYIYISHVAEDYPREKWPSMFSEFKRCLKDTGFLVVLVPERTVWQYCVQVLGQCPNCNHHGPEPEVGDMSRAATQVGMKVVEERMTNLFENDYTILGVFTK